MSFKCPKCGEEFSSEKGLKVHQSKAHDGNNDENELKEIESISTGIEGVDELMEEGIPKGSSVLIEGGPGSGKTIFSLQVAKESLNQDKKVLYMSFEERVRRLVDHMREFDWDVGYNYEENDSIQIKRYNALDIARSVEALLSEAKRELLIEVKPMLFPEDFEPDIVIIDSLTSIASAFSGERSRFRIYMEQLFRYLEKEDITSFLIRETPNPTHIGVSSNSPGGAVSFLSDGIIAIYNAIHPTGKRDKGIEIVKMRGENFKAGVVSMEIVNNKGIIVDPDQRLQGDYNLT